MPAAAVIPAPIAYIKVVAVKKLVVGLQFRTDGTPPGVYCHAPNSLVFNSPGPAGSPGVLFIECPEWLASLL